MFLNFGRFSASCFYKTGSYKKKSAIPFFVIFTVVSNFYLEIVGRECRLQFYNVKYNSHKSIVMNFV